MTAPNEHERQLLAEIAGRQVIRMARAIVGDDYGLLSGAIFGALVTVIASAEDPVEVLATIRKLLDDTRPAILALHAKLHAEVARINAGGRPATGGPS